MRGPGHAMKKGGDRMQEQNERKDLLEEYGAVQLPGDPGTVCTLTIIGQIEGHQVLPEAVKTTKYEHILPLLASVEQSDRVEGLLLLLNTVGGDIEAGLAIAELIAGMKKPTVSLVLGGGHSIGVPLAVCAKKSFIARTAGMTIHPVRMTGTVIGAPQTYQYLQRIREQIVEFVTLNSRIERERFLSYMMATGEMASDVGTVIYGQQAVDCGLIDRVGSLSDALTALRQMINRRKRRGGLHAVQAE